MATKIFNMVGPPGAVGATGATGARGPTGNQGPPGGPGAAGSAPATAISTDTGNVATLGTDSLLYVPQPVVPPMANAIQNGLLTQVSGLTTDFVNGANSCQDLGTAARPAIWTVKTNSTNTIGNPNFEIDQINVGAALTNPATGTFLCDRWALNKSGNHQIMSQIFSGTPIQIPGTSYNITGGALNLYLMQRQVTVAATDYLAVTQRVEGVKGRALFGGPTSVSLLIRSTVAPLTFAISIRSPDVTSSWVQLCTIPNAAITLIQVPSIPFFSGGNFTPVAGTAGYSLSVCFTAGSNYLAPSVGQWVSGNFLGAAGMSNWITNTGGPQIFLYFVQHEPGATPTQFMDLPFQDNLRQCLRYFWKSTSYSMKCPTSGNWRGIGQFVSNSNLVRCRVLYPFEMAINPTVAMFDNTVTANAVYIPGVGSVAIASTSGNTHTLQGVTLSASNSYTISYAALGQFTATAAI
jgi:hypothetical protein